MLISGYVFAHSYKSRGIADLKSCYNLSIFKKRVKRLYIPFLAIYFLQILISKFILSKNIDIYFFFCNLILGGFGPGSYYPIIMFQFLCIIPVIYIISYKKLDYSIPIFFAISIIFEIFTYLSGMEEWLYRLLIGRYVFAIALGVYLALNQNKMDKKLLYGGSILSIVYMYTSVYFDYHMFGHNYWLPHQAPAYFYSALLFVTGINLLTEKAGLVLTAVAELGKASWHIFLIQMLYFWTQKGFTTFFFPKGLNADSIIAVLFNLAICLIFGYLFYLLEDRILSQKASIKV